MHLSFLITLWASLVTLAAAGPPAAPGAPAAPDSLLDYALVQWRGRPAMQMHDAYKWLFQAALGGEHAIADESGPRRWMEQEWKGLGTPLKGESLAESLRADGSLLRINLRPFKAGGGKRDLLLEAFVLSAREFHGDKKEFLRAWEDLGRRLQAGPVNQLGYPAWKALDEEAKPLGYPAVHHSPEYEKANHPAYRVVTSRVWREKTGR